MGIKYISAMSKKECEHFIRENVDFFNLRIGQEHFSGWTKFGLFSISYKRGHIGRNTIYNKAVGRISSKDGKTIVTFHLYKGLTDIFSLLQILIGTFIILSIARVSYELDVVIRIVLSALLCVFPAIITFVCTHFSDDGLEGEAQLHSYLVRNLKLSSIIDQ